MKASSAVSTQYTNVTDGRTDGHHTTSKAALFTASHGKNVFMVNASARTGTARCNLKILCYGVSTK